ncbi:threonine--tRNA ligase [Candidatus Woesebacteria bacterium]|nr:threonine--tRNA ligase [Candidatus Woesebacteria bacterium]
MSQHNDEKLAQLSPEALELWKMRHTAEHVLHQAVKELYPSIHLAMGPATDEGFYFDFDASPEGAEPIKISEDDFPNIEKRMQELIAQDLPLLKEEVPPEEAEKLFAGNPYKQEWISLAAQRGEKIMLYWTGKQGESGSMVDLCAGPHAESTGAIRAFKLLSVAGAYWHGDEKNKMLTRIYGTAFFSQKELEAYLELREEAKRRDHRKLGKELELFFIDEVVGKGLVMWLPKGATVKEQIEKYVKEQEAAAGYVRVSTPHIAREDLYLTSGHLPYYKESMYPPMVMDDATYYMKAMNCPHHHRIFLHKPHSYKELPLRLAEYGTCYRNELSGTLAGLLRVRALAMNDAHIYCRKDQIKDEFAAVVRLTQGYFETFGLENYWFRLSKWDPAHTDKYINQPENWQYSEQILREVLQDMQVPFVEVDDEAAFYGPKVDVQFKSVIGREETMSTIQLDFVAKERFNLSYIDESGAENHEVFVIHRAPLSTHERFIAFLLEHYAGAFPTWLAPVQVKVLPIADRHHDYAKTVVESLSAQGVRVELDDRSERLQAKIRDAQLQKIPYMLVVGDTEAKDQSVAVRKRSGGKQEVISLKDFANKIIAETKTRSRE